MNCVLDVWLKFLPLQMKSLKSLGPFAVEKVPYLLSFSNAPYVCVLLRLFFEGLNSINVHILEGDYLRGKYCFVNELYCLKRLGIDQNLAKNYVFC